MRVVRSKIEFRVARKWKRRWNDIIDMSYLFGNDILLFAQEPDPSKIYRIGKKCVSYYSSFILNQGHCDLL